MNDFTPICLTNWELFGKHWKSREDFQPAPQNSHGYISRQPQNVVSSTKGYKQRPNTETSWPKFRYV